MADESLPFALSLVTNQSPESAAAVSRRKPAQSAVLSTEPLGLSWPSDVVSLSHVALPFPPDDPLYGRRPPDNEDTIFLGQLDFKGELGVLVFSSDRLLRLRHNPFYDYLETRTIDWIDHTSGRPTRSGQEVGGGD